MNIMNSVTWKTMKQNRVRTIVTTIGIILSATMFTAVTVFCSSMYSYLMHSAVYMAGNYHIGVNALSGEELLSFRKDERVEAVHAAKVLGYADIGSENEYKPYIYVEAADSEFFENMPIHLTKGRLPMAENELLLSEHLSYNGAVGIALGDKLTLSLGDRILNGSILTQSNEFEPEANEKLTTKYSRTFTVVGFCERPRYEQISAPGYTAITYCKDAPEADAVYDSYILIKDLRHNYAPFMAESGLAENDHIIENETVMMFNGYSRFSNWTNMLYSIAAVFCVLIFIGSVSLIYSAFSISVNERTKQFGLLSSIGATHRQIRRSVFTEALTLSAIGIPIGLGIGMLGMGITLYFCRGLFSSFTPSDSEITLKVSAAAILIAIFIALLTVLVSVWIPSKRAMRITPIEAIRQSKDVKIGKRRVRYSELFYKIFGAEGVLAKKYYARSRGKYRATIVSLAMSLMLFISSSSFCMYLTNTVDLGANRSDYDVTMPISASNYERINSRLVSSSAVDDSTLLFFDNTCEYFASIPRTELTDKYNEIFLSDFSTEPELYSLQTISKCYIYDDRFFELAEKCGVSREEYEAFEADGINPALFCNHGIYVEYTQDDSRITHSFEFFKPGITSIRTSRPYGGLPDGYRYAGIDVLDSGEFAYLFRPYDDEADSDGAGSGAAVTIPMEYEETKLAGFVEQLPAGLDLGAGIILMYPMSAFPEERLESQSSILFIRSTDPDAAVEELKAALNDAAIPYVDSSIYNVAEDEKLMRNIVTLVEVFSYGFIVLISLISIANVFNTISTNVSLRRRDYAMLRSIGMTYRGMNRMTNFECILYGTHSLLIGLPLAAAFTYLIYIVVAKAIDFAFTLPWTSVVISVLCVFIVVFVSMLYSTSKVKRDNPIDALKLE